MTPDANTPPPSIPEGWTKALPLCPSIYSKVLFFFGTALVTQYITGRAPLGAAVFGVLVTGAGGAMYSFELKSIQKKSNEEASTLYTKVVAETADTRPLFFDYSVYLRRFESEDELRQIHSGNGLPPILPDLWEDRIRPRTFEADLSDQLYGWCPLIGLGHADTLMGAAKLPSTDIEWQEKIMNILRQAKWIFVTPANSESLLWEIQQVIATPGLLSKTIFVAPPNSFVSSFGIEQRWTASAAAFLKRFGLHLPAYNPRGLAFSISSTGTIENGFFLQRKRGGRVNFRKLLMRMEHLDASTLANIDKTFRYKCHGGYLILAVLGVVFSLLLS